MITEREFLHGIRRSIGKIVSARSGRSSMSINHAIMDAILTFLYYQERYTEPKRGSTAIIKPLLLIAFRSRKSFDCAIHDIVTEIDRIAPPSSRPGAYSAPPDISGAPTSNVLAPSVVATGDYSE